MNALIRFGQQRPACFSPVKHKLQIAMDVIINISELDRALMDDWNFTTKGMMSMSTDRPSVILSLSEGSA
jgi:hypothetical protein